MLHRGPGFSNTIFWAGLWRGLCRRFRRFASVREGRRAHRPAAGRAGEGKGLLVLAVVLVFMLMLVLVLLLLLLVLVVMMMMVLAVSRGRRLLSKHGEWSRYHGMHPHLQRLLFTYSLSGQFHTPLGFCGWYDVTA